MTDLQRNNLRGPILIGLLAILLLGNVGLVVLGTFYAAMASRSRARRTPDRPASRARTRRRSSRRSRAMD